MSNALRLLAMMFYAPARAMSEVRERAPLIYALLLALAAESLYGLYTQWPFFGGDALSNGRAPLIVFAVVVQTAMLLFFTALAFVPIIIFVANAFERRASFRVALQQDYAAIASTVFYAAAATNLIGLPLAFLSRAIRLDASFAGWYLRLLAQSQRDMPDSPLLASSARLADPRVLSASFFQLLLLPILFLLLMVGVREAFRFSYARAAAVVLLSGCLFLIATSLLTTVFGFVFASPFLLVMLFLVLRGYFGDVMATQRARASFKQNLEAATLNPADASAHYNLGLIHQQRGQLEEARARFQKAVEIDADEADAHYQLGRIARTQNRFPEAIQHFSEVVERDETHAQHEIWREIGATYLAAGQFEDARDALEKFLARRTVDPEGLYLMGRAQAGLGHTREAANAMQACIEAVKSAPAYKYRAEKRWLNEAQQFLRSQA
ncbi:MAG: tetratricopeptide repeat protein [Pyrinomonadaceae bacterium]